MSIRRFPHTARRSAVRVQAALRPGALGQLAALTATRARSVAGMVARSSSVRRAILKRLLAAGLCACLALWVGRGLSDAADIRSRWGPRVTVLVARHDLAPGESISRSDTLSTTRPRSLTPSDALDELAPGATASAMILAGEPLVGARMDQDDDRLIPTGTTAIRLELAVAAPELRRGDHVDILGPTGPTYSPGGGPPLTPDDHAEDRIGVIAPAAVVIRPPTGEDPTIEVAVPDAEVPPVANAAFSTGVAVVRR